jgi:hypothetical protein
LIYLFFALDVLRIAGQGYCVVMRPHEIALIVVFVTLLVGNAIGFFYPDLLPLF